MPPEDVIFVAHSTTQATNALIEGDVACVGVLGMGARRHGRFSGKSIRPALRISTWDLAEA